jgi:hypothetical protein
MTDPALAAEIAAGVRSGAISAVRVIERTLERIARLDGRLNAFTQVMPERALREAAAIDARRWQGEDPNGIKPVGIKRSVPCHVAPDGGTIGRRGRGLMHQTAVEHDEDAVGKLEQLVEILADQ